jgi:ABC-type multidrug transport system fused ATPase/permease subunit
MEAGVTGNSFADAARHPIGLIVTDDLRRWRLTVFFRLLLAIPQIIWLSIWSIAVIFTVLIAWFAGIVTGRVPDGLHNFNAAFLRYATRVTGYLFLLADPWPGFSNTQPYPIDARVDSPVQQSRLTVFFRLILAIPALILVYVFRAVNEVVAFFAWFYCLVTGRMHEGMRNLSAWLLRYEVQTYAYLMLLTGRYPSLAGAPTA